MDVLLTQTVLVAILDEALGGINHEHALARCCLLLIQHQDARRYARAIEQVSGQSDDGLDVTTLDDVTPDSCLGIATKQHAMRQDART